MGLSRSAKSAKHPHMPRYQVHRKSPKADPFTFTISWNKPVAKKGVLGSEIAGTEISWKEKDSPYWEHKKIRNPDILKFSITVKEPGTYLVRLASYDRKGRHSNYTVPIEIVIDEPI